MDKRLQPSYSKTMKACAFIVFEYDGFKRFILVTSLLFKILLLNTKGSVIVIALLQTIRLTNINRAYAPK